MLYMELYDAMTYSRGDFLIHVGSKIRDERRLFVRWWVDNPSHVRCYTFFLFFLLFFLRCKGFGSLKIPVFFVFLV